MTWKGNKMSATYMNTPLNKEDESINTININKYKKHREDVLHEIEAYFQQIKDNM